MSGDERTKADPTQHSSPPLFVDNKDGNTLAGAITTDFETLRR